MSCSKLTWNKETRAWKIEGPPFVNSPRFAAIPSVKANLTRKRGALDLTEKERLRQGWIAMGKTPARADYLVFLSTCPHAVFLKVIKHELKRRNGKCLVFGSHRWNGGNGFCTRCGAEKRTKGMGKKITKLARYLNIKRSLLSKMLNDDRREVERLVKRAIAERSWKVQRARFLENLEW
jgi:hypothetical protein